MIIDFFKKKRQQLEESPLEYWEENSYIHALSRDDKSFTLDADAINRIRNLTDVKLIGHMLPVYEEGKPGVLFVEYMGYEYEVYYYYDDLEISDINMLLYQKHLFSDEEIDKIQKVKKALTSYMKFNDDVRASYILQLKLLVALMPDALAFEDESAEKLMNRKWVELAIHSKLPCAFSDLYSIQGVEGENGDIWLHTHGLARCNIAELEILQSCREFWDQHCNTISTLANLILEGEYDEEENCTIIGQFMDGNPIIVRKISWTQGVLKYNIKTFGTEKERKSSHNSKREIIVALMNDKVYTMDKIDKRLGDNPIFYFSNSETERMKDLALERFSYVRKVMKEQERESCILVKMGLKTDYSNQENKKEYIWFELLGLDGETMHLKLTQEPYYISNLHEGDEGEYLLEDLTDWLIFNTPRGTVSPGTAYLLDI